VDAAHRALASFRKPAAVAWVDFCLRPRAVTKSVTLVRVAPVGVSIALTQKRALTLSHVVRAGRSATTTVAAAVRAELVQILLDRRRARISVLVNGTRRVTFPAPIPAGVHIIVGSSASTVSAVNVATSPVTPARASVVPHNPFAPTSFWNARLSSTAPIDPNSKSYVNGLVSQVSKYGAWMNTNSYSVPVYVVPSDQPTVKVTLNTWGPDLQQAWKAVPIPAGSVAASGTDESMAVWQPSTDKMWDFWLMHQTSGAWSARWGGEMDNVSTNPGYYTHSGQTNNWGATGTGVPLLGGLVTIADLRRGSIKHALALAVPLTEANLFSWPAQRTDGRSTDATALPEGVRFRIDPNLDIASLKLPYLDRMLAQAAQTYGIVIQNTSGAVTFYAQDPTPTGSNPWASPFDGRSEGTYLSWLPWSHMEALKTQLSG
jgi:hypothetical protein